MIVNDRFGIDAEGVIHRGKEFGRVDRVFGRAAARFVRFAVNVSALDAGAGDN